MLSDIYASLAYGAVFALQTTIYLIVALVAALIWFQGKLLYMPTAHTKEAGKRGNAFNPLGYRSPAEYNLPYEEMRCVTADGVPLHGWLIRHVPERDGSTKKHSARGIPTILFFHGNAGNIGFRLDNALPLVNICQCNVVRSHAFVILLPIVARVHAVLVFKRALFYFCRPEDGSDKENYRTSYKANHATRLARTLPIIHLCLIYTLQIIQHGLLAAS